MNKLFLPPGATVRGTAVVTSDGIAVPSWACVAVPIEADKPRPRKKAGSSSSVHRFLDLATGRVSAGAARTTTASATLDVSGFDGRVDLDALSAALVDALPGLLEDSLASVTDPGYFEQTSGASRTAVPVSVAQDDSLVSSYPIGGGLTLSDALVWKGKTQVLSGQRGVSARDVVLAIKHVATNVVSRVNDVNDYFDPSVDSRFVSETLSYSVYSWFAESDEVADDPASYVGACVKLLFSGSSAAVYRKAVDLAVKLPCDSVTLDYRSDGPTLVTVVSRPGGGGRRVRTRYDGVVTSRDKLLHCVKNSDVPSASPDPTGEDGNEVSHWEGDDYAGLYEAVLSNASAFGGTSGALSLLQSLGYQVNPLVSGLVGSSPGAGTSATSATRSALAAVAGALRCPDQSSDDAKLFPTSSHPFFRHLTDHTQLDDTSTQDKTPVALRFNNPLRVKRVAGVTDLKTRFGYLGEAEGYAVYRDRVGGAAAGLAYLATMAGSTFGSAAKSLAGTDLASGVSGSASSTDLTALTPAKLFQGVTQSLFGVADPTGAVAECATVTDSRDSLIRYAAALSKTVSGLDASPLTRAEWNSAYQIHKNEPNGHVTKTTTGKDLPAQEDEDTQDTGTVTEGQGRETAWSRDKAKRGETEKWNPVSNFAHYSSNVWGPDGSDWVSRGVVAYEQKSSSSDVDKMAKADETVTMAQDAKNPTTFVDLDWDPEVGNA